MQGEMDRGVPQRDNCRMYVHHPSPPPVPLHVPTASREDALTVRRVRPDFGDECQTLRMRCTKRSTLGPLFGAPHPSQPPTAVSRRNARERKRVRLVNMGFATLRDHVPSGVKNKKLSKVETLRSAIEYIKQLQELLGDKDSHSFEEMARDFYDASQGSPEEGFESSHPTLFEEESSEDIPMIPVNNNAAKEPIFSSSPASSMASDYSSSSPYATHPSEEFIDIGSWFS